MVQARTVVRSGPNAPDAAAACISDSVRTSAATSSVCSPKRGIGLRGVRPRRAASAGNISEPVFRRTIVLLSLSRILGTILAQLLFLPAALLVVVVAGWM